MVYCESTDHVGVAGAVWPPGRDSEPQACQKIGKIQNGGKWMKPIINNRHSAKMCGQNGNDVKWFKLLLLRSLNCPWPCSLEHVEQFVIIVGTLSHLLYQSLVPYQSWIEGWHTDPGRLLLLWLAQSDMARQLSLSINLWVWHGRGRWLHHKYL